MDAEEELKKTIEGVQARQARQQADAEQQRLAAQSKVNSEAALVEQFVSTILPSVVDENLPKVSRIVGRPIHTASGSPGNQFHGDHHDWYYAFEVGRAEAVAESHRNELEIRINGQPYQIGGAKDRDAAIKLFNAVVERGLSG